MWVCKDTFETIPQGTELADELSLAGTVFYVCTSSWIVMEAGFYQLRKQFTLEI